jgi:hypothetical protein
MENAVNGARMNVGNLVETKELETGKQGSRTVKEVVILTVVIKKPNYRM